MAAVPAHAVDRQAIVRAIGWLPERLYGEYLGKLTDGSRQQGTLHELRVIGKLLRLDGKRYHVDPPPAGDRYDALLVVGHREIELEITALVKPRYDASVDGVCRRLEGWLLERSPGRGFEVRISNEDGAFVEGLDERGRTFLDVDATFTRFTEELSRAIDDHGIITDAYRNGPPGGAIASIEPNATTWVYQGIAKLPGDLDIEQARRKVLAKVKDPQWTGQRPGVLVVVLDHWPNPEILGWGTRSAAREAFAGVESLTALVALPYRNTLVTPLAYFPDSPERAFGLDSVEREILIRSSRFWLGNNWLEALPIWRRARAEHRKVVQGIPPA